MSKRLIFYLLLSIIIVSGFFLGCRPQVPKEALQLSPQSLKNRQMQTRRFETSDEKSILSASAGVLQDLGFTLDESETDLGVLCGSKTRDATSGGQIFGSILLALFTGVAKPVDSHQIIRASLVSYPSLERKGSVAVRITFQRIIINTQGQATKRECIINEKIYKEFFEKLSKSVFLEAHQI